MAFKILNCATGQVSPGEYLVMAAAEAIAKTLSGQQDVSWKQSFAVIEILDSQFWFKTPDGRHFQFMAPTAAEARIAIAGATGVNINELDLQPNK